MLDKKVSLKDEVVGFAKHWSGHGVGKVIESGSVVKKIFYSFVLMAMFGMFGWNLRLIISKYYQYPVATTIEVN